MIPIVKPYLPDISRYQRYIEDIYRRNWLTNRGPLHQELEVRLAEYLAVDNLMLVANGTLALQVAYRALGLEQGQVLTTPFTFAATPGSLLWQNLQPRFVDIDASSLNLDPDKIDLQMLEEASAILSVHVFGNPCQVEEIDALSERHGLKVIYDAAHAFASPYKKGTVLQYGDAATLSLHATKIFHCVEGGAIIFKNAEVMARARQLINFGFDKDNHPQLIGINAKMSEVHAAMGLAMLDDIDNIIERRQAVVHRYQRNLAEVCQFQQWHQDGQNNGAYAPVIFESDAQLLSVSQTLQEAGIQSRRYFYPSLSECGVYQDRADTPVSADISRRVLCLPLYYELTTEDQDRVCQIIKASLGN